MAGLTIQEMRLAPNAAQAAALVLKAHPGVVFTSGRRDVMDQARVMAANVVRYGPAWLKDAYNAKHPRMVKVLMTYTEEHPEQASDRRILALAFYGQLQEHYAGELWRFPHVRGGAFDIAWPRIDGGLANKPELDGIVATIWGLPKDLGLEVVLAKEGKLEVIHAQFSHTVEV